MADKNSVITYVGLYKRDENNNGIPDDEDVLLNEFNIVPKTGDCHKNYICPYLEHGNPRVEVVFDIEDDMDATGSEGDLLVCLSEDPTACAEENAKVCDEEKDPDNIGEYVDKCILNKKYIRILK